MTSKTATVLLLALALSLGGCGGDEGETGAGSGTPANASPAEAQAPKPTKAALVQTLRDLLAALEAGDDDRAALHLVLLPGMQPEDVPVALDRILERKDLTAEGIDILAQEGAFGELDDLLKERGKSWAAHAGVNENRCYALVFDDAEVAAFWDGAAFRIFHLDDVGNMK
jgi:hypothetical protein